MTATLDHLTDEQLADAYCQPEADYAALRAAEKARQRRRAAAEPWREMAHAQFLQAERECEGNLVNDKGRNRVNEYGRPDPVDPWSLFMGSQWAVDAYASWELLRFWETHPRITHAEYQRQQRRERREEREYGLDADEAAGFRQVTEEAARVQRDSGGHVVPGPGRSGQAQRERASADAGRSAATWTPTWPYRSATATP